MVIFIYLFIYLMDIYIAPLQGIYSEALPTLARRKRTVLRLERNTDGIDLGRRRSSRGSPFQVEGPRTEKARFCLMEVRANGTWRRPCSEDGPLGMKYTERNTSAHGADTKSAQEMCNTAMTNNRFNC